MVPLQVGSVRAPRKFFSFYLLSNVSRVMVFEVTRIATTTAVSNLHFFKATIFKWLYAGR